MKWNAKNISAQQSLGTTKTEVWVDNKGQLIKPDIFIEYKIQTIYFQDSLQEQDLNKIDTSPLYFTRTRGLFRECFLNENDKPTPGLVELYVSPVETYCRNIDYYIPDKDNETAKFGPEMMTRIRE